ncbi:nitroreductase family protein [Pseudoxanthomonas indica]|uniref:Putative NAD(P)H nitroreductase n=1 Tax=Pseudoxanthomonas indica TaxID=428993 RepID=A0A1T5JNV7_9GAMM|nr:nitroreductase [Pseudoxanthomonas indica]GGD43391.1 nitroreductase [Pseudoxanthomonas indica]SKC52928.1 Nitroreductase [Pseudoxanthomonas indica]
MSASNPLQFLDERRSIPSKQLGEPGPDAATLRRMLAAAVRVPDHGKLVPFRFLHLHGPARQHLGDALAALTLQRDPDAPAAAVEKDRGRFAHAPDIIVVIARLTPGHKVPEQEQLLTAGSVCFALLQAAQALGFGAQWLTAWMAYDASVARLLGLADNERVVGFIHIGTAKLEAPERERPDVDALLAEWQPES